MTIKLPKDVEIEINTRLPYDFDDIIRKIFKEYLEKQNRKFRF